MDLFDMWRERLAAFSSRLTADEAAARLKRGLSTRRAWVISFRMGADSGPSHLVFGDIAGRRVRIYARRPLQRQSWRAIMDGELAPTSTGSELIGKINYPAFVRVFMALWLFVVLSGVLAAATAGGVLFAQGTTNDGRSSLFAAAFLSVMFAFGLLVMTIGNGYGRADESYLRAWIRRAIDASEIQSG